MVEKLIRRLSNIKEKNNYRTLQYYDKKYSKYIFIEGHRYLNFSSNDYLGISTDVDLLRDFYDSIELDLNWHGFSSASSRLISGNPIIYKMLEEELATFLGKKRAIVFNSGYHMNIGVLPALTDKRDLILSDKLNHASIIDGLRLSEAKHIRYKHLDYDGLEAYLEKNRNGYENVFIVTESLFSMDGDIADLKRLVEIKRRFSCYLYVDEAHSIGVYGNGKGIAYEMGVLDKIDLLAGTFGKAFSSVGGFIATDDLFFELIVNFSRPFIFTTGLPPVVVFWNYFILKKIPTLVEKINKLFMLSKRFRSLLIQMDYKTLGNSYIVPLILGDSNKTLEVSKKLRESGVLVPAIRPPTVPEGTSRLRFSLNSLMDEEDIELVLAGLKGGET